MNVKRVQRMLIQLKSTELCRSCEKPGGIPRGPTDLGVHRPNYCNQCWAHLVDPSVIRAEREELNREPQ